MAMDTDAGFGGDLGGFSGGQNEGKNAEDRSTQAGVTDSNGGAFGLGGTAPAGSNKGISGVSEEDQSIEKDKEVTSSIEGEKGLSPTGIGFIDRKVDSFARDPLGTLIGLALGVTPLGSAASIANLAQSATSDNLSKGGSVGAVISGAIMGLLSGDITAAPASQLAANDKALGLAGNTQPESTLYSEQSSGLNQSSAQQQNPSPTVTGTAVSQPSAPLAQTEVRGSNPYAPSIPLVQGVGSIWL